jgi:hypothetical protein
VAVQPEAMVKIGHLVPRLALLSGLGLGVAVLATSGRWRRVAGWCPLAGLLALALYECSRHEPWQEFLGNVPAWIAYTGWPVVVVGVGGLVVGFARSPPSARAWLSLLATLLLFMLLHKHAAHLFPWATKRWLPTTVLLLGVGAAFLVEASRRSRARWIRPVGAALIAGVLFSQGNRLLFAMRSQEYAGFPSALAKVAEVIGPRDVVVADHFWAGTPMALTYGKLVLNAEPLWADNDERRREEAMVVLDRLRADGYRILLFTSTRAGAARLPGRLGASRLLTEWPRSHYPEVIHHARNTGFQKRARGATFRLYEWTGG